MRWSGYARTSTSDQKAGLEAQLRDLNNAGCGKIFKEGDVLRGFEAPSA